MWFDAGRGRGRRLLALAVGVLALHLLALGALHLGATWRGAAPVPVPALTVTLAEPPRPPEPPPAVPPQTEPVRPSPPVPVRELPRRAAAAAQARIPVAPTVPSAARPTPAVVPTDAPSDRPATEPAPAVAQAPAATAVAATPSSDGAANRADARPDAATGAAAPAMAARPSRSAAVACANFQRVMGELAYPREALRLRLPRGDAQVQFILTPGGEVRDVRAVSASHPAFARSAVQAVGALRCAAAGEEVIVTVPFTYTLRDAGD
jgi:TonB family protein